MSTTHAGLDGSKRRLPPGSRALRRCDPNEPAIVTLKLRRKAPLPFVHDGARLDRHTLYETHGASQEDADLTVKALTAMGLHCDAPNLASRTLRVAGRLVDLETAFGVSLFQYSHGQGEYRGRVGSVSVPKALSDIVTGVFGLDTRPTVRSRRRTQGCTALAKAIARLRTRYSRIVEWQQSFFPSELATVYGFPAHDGAGQCIAVLEFGGGYFPADMAQFATAASLPRLPFVVLVSVDGTPTDAVDGAEGEVMLDFEVLAGLCPAAKIVGYFTSFTEQGWIEGLDAIVHDTDNAPSVVSISWGDSEDGASWSFAAIAEFNEVLQEAALLGITVCVAAGDDGSDDQVGDGYAHVDFPASSPYVLAVGGTTLVAAAGKLIAESAWKDGSGLRSSGGGSTGGGVSIVFDPPPWQSSARVASINPQVAPGRVVPDVAANASANTGYVMVVDGQLGVSGGTSAAAPLWAGLVARLNALTLSTVGFLTPKLYASVELGGRVGPLGSLACRDITDGDNATAAIGGYTATTGFDAVTGWGVPVGSALLEGLTAAPKQ